MYTHTQKKNPHLFLSLLADLVCTLFCFVIPNVSRLQRKKLVMLYHENVRDLLKAYTHSPKYISKDELRKWANN